MIQVFIIQAREQASDFYWSINNEPCFYGATKIEMSKNVVETFDPTDIRFRVFAKDFEDGDLMVSCIRNTVEASKPGTYEVIYQTEDSDHHQVSLTVPVTILDNNDFVIKMERTMYTIPNDWNMTLAGFSRCNSGDRQHLGIYLPSHASFKMKVIEGNRNITVSMLANDAYKETSQTINYQASDAVEVTNEYKESNPAQGKIPGNYANVPFLTSPKLNRYESIDTTCKIEIEYDTRVVKPLNYYYPKEDEAKFKTQWRESQDEFAVIENDVLTVLVPLQDIDTTDDYEFNTLDEFLNYYHQVVYKMDEMIGLSYHPTKATDQNIHAKYLVKANKHGAGAAYYAGNHVGINSDSLHAFFEMNWGGLHEIAHGYQGYLGKGTMELGETSNNILGHYVQMNKEIFFADKDWLGKLKNTEEKYNQGRLEGKVFNDFGQDPAVKLYALINLFDYFEKEETYAKLFRYYREKLNENIFTPSTPNQDIYALFFYDTYQTNILPYWNAWGLPVSEETLEIVSKAPKTISILYDVSQDKCSEIMNQENFSLKYGLVSSDVLSKYHLKSTFTVKIKTDTKETFDQHVVLLEKEGKIVEQATIKNGVATFTDIATDSYLLRTPTSFDYTTSLHYVTLKPGNNTIDVSYTSLKRSFDHPTMIRIRGAYYDTTGYIIRLSENNLKASIDLGASNLGNQNDEWKNKPNEVFASVTIKNKKGKIIDCQEVKGNGYFSLTNVHYKDIDLEYGYTIEIYTMMPNCVQVISSITNQVIDEYKETSLKTLIFEVTKDGLLPKYKDHFALKDILYQESKDFILDQLNQLVLYFEEHNNDVKTKYLSKQEKEDFLYYYDQLNSNDQVQYQKLMQEIIQGGSPSIEVLQKEVTVSSVDDFKWNDYLKVYDSEDGYITLNQDNVHFSSFDGKTKGDYTTDVIVSDSDGNESSVEMILHVLTTQKKEGCHLFKDTYLYMIIAFSILLFTSLGFITKKRRIKKKS